MASQNEVNKTDMKMLNTSPTSNQIDHQQQDSLPTFSIATPAVTNMLPISESISDTSFMLPTVNYHHDELSMELQQNSQSNYITTPCEVEKQLIKSEIITGSAAVSQAQQSDIQIETKLTVQPSATGSDRSLNEANKPNKKRNKAGKKNTKLDAKSKLEKSRQSARECRARKKLRYQYLEDLVCNREKAVVKLREELSMFCELSKHFDVGSLNDNDRRLLVDQTKENTSHEEI